MKVSERSIAVTLLSAFALGLMAVYRPWLVLVMAAIFAAPFLYLWADWKRTRKRKFWD